MLRDPTVASGTGQLGAIQAVAPSFGVELTPVDLRTAGGIERAVTVFARKPNGGLIRAYVDHGGLISYGPDIGRGRRRRLS